MPMLINILLLAGGFILLIFGADLLVDGSASLAKRLKIPNIVIGLTIVAFGTSSPELIVNIFSSVQGTSSLAFGNIIGSNILNIALILGISAIIRPLNVKHNTTWYEIPLCMLAAVTSAVLINDKLIDHSEISCLSRIDGIILLLFFAVFLIYSLQIQKRETPEENTEIKDFPLYRILIYIMLGFAGLLIGGKMIVSSSVKIAQKMNISERLIGLTIVALGTSLPELATSITAAVKKNVDIAIGNVVGSNIFNTFFILGLSAVINPVPLGLTNRDIAVNLFISFLLFLFIFTGKGRKIDRWEGLIFTMIYTGYLFLLIFIPADRFPF